MNLRVSFAGLSEYLCLTRAIDTELDARQERRSFLVRALGNIDTALAGIGFRIDTGTLLTKHVEGGQLGVLNAVLAQTVLCRQRPDVPMDDIREDDLRRQLIKDLDVISFRITSAAHDAQAQSAA